MTLIEDFNHTVDIWITALDQYDFEKLSAKPAPGKWSIGQVYMHLISQTDYFIKQAKICASNNDHANEAGSSIAKQLFLRNDFPNELLEGPPSNDHNPQPDSKGQLLRDLIRIKDEFNQAVPVISKSLFKGKTKHPGLNYFNANEWLHCAEMHFRHHLRQKERIDEFIKNTY
jgi:DinB superfamily